MTEPMTEERWESLCYWRDRVRDGMTLVGGMQIKSIAFPMLTDAVNEIERLQEEVGNLVLSARKEVAENADLRAEIDRLREGYESSLDPEYDCAEMGACRTEVEGKWVHVEPPYHAIGCTVRWAWDILNPEATS